MQRNIIIILGTRPEAIKLAPIILSLQKCTEYKVWVCNTEQQKELSNQALAFFGIKADFTLNTMTENQSLSSVQSRMLIELAHIFSVHSFDATIIQGDTMTALCGALTSLYYKIPIFHVEAGLRSYNNQEPFPEESIRRMIGSIATLHFAPTEQAYGALLKENIPSQDIHCVGNTVIDALSCLSEESIAYGKNILDGYGIVLHDKLVLITVHRRENQGESLYHIIEAIRELSQQFKDHLFIVPLHPNPNIHNVVHDMLAHVDNIILMQPLAYPALVLLMQYAKLILTDSGGIQEEAPTFGTPLLILRNTTEREEGVRAGCAQLVGTKEEDIIQYASTMLVQDREAIRNDTRINPYGDGHASERIILKIQEYFREVEKNL